MKDSIAMKCHLTALVLSALVITAGFANQADSTDQKARQPSKLDRIAPKALRLECHPTKPHFLAAEPVIIRCVLTNTTGTTIAWRGPRYFFSFQGDSNLLFSTSTPHLLSDLILQKVHGKPLIDPLPPHTSVEFLLLVAPRPEKFKGLIIYDPVAVKPGFVTDEEMAKERGRWVYSNLFEYETTATERKQPQSNAPNTQ